MLKTKAAFSGFSVDDLAKAKEFYTEVVGLEVVDERVGLRLQLPGGGTVFIYQKGDHQPSTFTILNFMVDNIDQAVDELTRLGVKFEQYRSGPINTDGKGVARGRVAKMGPDIAWFNNVSGKSHTLFRGFPLAVG